MSSAAVVLQQHLRGFTELVSVEVLSPRGSPLASDFYRLVEDLLAEIGQLAGEGVDRLDQSIAKLPTLQGVGTLRGRLAEMRPDRVSEPPLRV